MRGKCFHQYATLAFLKRLSDFPEDLEEFLRSCHFKLKGIARTTIVVLTSNTDIFYSQKAIKEYDEFEEWIDGSTKLRYSPYSREAQAHISGWAMKYTNNHNKFVLKKTCVGVLLCSKDCTLPNGLKIVVRPAISDKGELC